MIDRFSSAVILLAGLYLVGLGACAFVAPSRAERFLLGFAGSASAHYLELGVRLMIGVAFVLQAPKMLLPGVFTALGWVLVLTTAGLFVMPWQWHRRFAQWAVPQAVRHLPLLGITSLAFGGFVLVATICNAA